MKKNILYVMGAILLLLIATNPSKGELKNVKARNETVMHFTNFIVFSICTDSHHAYLGIGGDFYKL